MTTDPSHYDSIEEYTAGVVAARREYALHPTVAIEEDWCEACCYPRKKKRCHVCTARMAERERRAGGAT